MALTKFDNVSRAAFDVPGNLDSIAVQESAVATLEVQQVKTDSAFLLAPVVLLDDVSELEDGMLLAAAGMLCGNVYDCALPSHQPA